MSLSWSANYIVNVPSVVVPCGRKPAAVEGSHGCYSAPPSLLFVLPNPERSDDFCKKAFTGRQRKGTRKTLEHTQGPPRSAVCHTVALGLPSPPLPLSWKIQRGCRTHPSSVTVAPRQPVNPCDLQELVLQSGQTKDSSVRLKGRVLLREAGILARRKAAFHEVSAEDPRVREAGPEPRRY